MHQPTSTISIVDICLALWNPEKGDYGTFKIIQRLDEKHLIRHDDYNLELEIPISSTYHSRPLDSQIPCIIELAFSSSRRQSSELVGSSMFLLEPFLTYEVLRDRIDAYSSTSREDPPTKSFIRLIHARATGEYKIFPSPPTFLVRSENNIFDQL